MDETAIAQIDASVEYAFLSALQKTRSPGGSYSIDIVD
jgi:hypothetical protein